MRLQDRAFEEGLLGKTNMPSAKTAKLYVYGAPSADGMVVSVFRLKYLPNIQDTGIGLQAEKDRAIRWAKILDESFGNLVFGEKHLSFG